MKAAWLAVTLLGGSCALDPFKQRYQPPGPPLSAEGPQAIALAPVADDRDVARDLPAQAVMPLTLGRSVADLAGEAFAQALAARGLLAGGNAPFLLRASLLRYTCHELGAEQADVHLHLTLTDRAGTPRYADDVETVNPQDLVFALSAGPAATPADLRNLAVRTLSQAIDQAIDKPAFRAIVATARPPLLTRLVTVQ